MQFRYKLAKEKFKGKKVPPSIRVSDDHVSADQRGNDSRLGDQILSLDRNTVTQPKPKEDLEYSRRDMFGLGRLGAYADQLSESFKEPPVKKKKGKGKRKRVPLSTEGETETAEVSPDVAYTAPDPKPGIFRRIWNWRWFRRTPKQEETPIATPNAGTVCEPAPQMETSPSQPVIPASSSTIGKEIEPEKPSPQKKSIFNLSDDEQEEEPEEEMSRRNLLRKSVHFLAKPMVDSVQNKVDKVNEVLHTVTKRVPLLRPPGAVSERQFLQLCTRCDECVHACPKDAIKKAPKSFGMLVLGTPYIDPLKKPCVMCDDLPCISVCPESALLPVASPGDVKMGYAILDQKKCVAYGSDSFCQQCVLDCPIPGAITQVQSRPVIHKNVCTGCGVCVKSCNTVNTPVAIKIKPQMVIESQIRKREMEKLKTQQTAEKQAAVEIENQTTEKMEQE
ncbi:MAG: hypothetical protein A3K09_08490 [Nitrospinae bacterium RIFCSPLOWO2_12_FULL_47_7]|nr:MAG: hypothetical protein A3K09_08490 [Nitrospinae bacterium RIFCSPLOWO2_12_FULL_47_7]